MLVFVCINLVLSIPLINNSKAIIDGDYYKAIFDDWGVGTRFINETIGGDKWLEVIPAVDYPEGVKVYSGDDKHYYFETLGTQSANCTFDLSYYTTDFFYQLEMYNGGNVAAKWFFNQIYRDSGNNQLFRILMWDNSAIATHRYIRVYDNADAVVDTYLGGAAPLLYVNVSMDLDADKVRVVVSGFGTYLNTGYFAISNFNYVDEVYFSLYGISVECTQAIDDFSVGIASFTPPKLWDTGNDYVGCANCDTDNYQTFSFASTNTIVLESDYKTFREGFRVEQVALGVSIDSDIQHMESWLRIGDYYQENRTRYYTYGENHYILVWENINTSYFDTVLPLEFKFITSVTSAYLYPYYLHSDIDGDGDIEYRYSLNGDYYDGSYNGSFTMGRDLCIEIFYGRGNISGDVNISVYNESNPAQSISNWAVTIVDKTTNIVEYQATNQSNPLVVNLTEFGIGPRLFIIEHEDYYSRSYYADIESGINYSLDAYLVHKAIGRYYCYQVVSGSNEFGTDIPLYDAMINISRFVNSTGGFIEVDTLFTDYNGYAYNYLIPGERYYFNVTKDDYTPSYSNFIVALNKDDCYIFRLEGIISSGPGWDNWYQNISLEANMISAGYLQLGNITVNYSDANFSTIDTHTYIYEVYNNTRTFMNYSYDYNNSFDLRFGDINTTRTHHVVLFYNNTASFIDQTSPVVIVLDAVDVYIGTRTRISFDDRIKNIIGPFTIKPDIWHDGVDIPWGHILAAIVGCIPLVIFGPKHTAIAIIASGIAIGGLDAFFGIWFTDSFPVLLISLAPILVVLGGVYHKVKGETL
jgi:hypothetical protein